MNVKNRIFSGAQPSGNLHIGNYLGAIRNWVNLQNEGNYDCIFSIVDLHAITVWQNPDELKESILELAATYIAAGVDPKKSTLFVQSSNPAHAELGWLMSCVARIGWLNRMTQFKEKAGKNKEKVSVGLYTYPCLMAADILAYKATHVPVGEDQKQHLELTRDCAQKFNHDFGVDFFPLPEPLILGEATRVMSLKDGTKKMSKSDVSDLSRINMTDDKDTIAKKIKKAKTDAFPIPEKTEELTDRLEAKNLINIYASFTQASTQDVLNSYAGKGFGEFKQDLADILVANFAPIASETQKLLQDKAYLQEVLDDGAKKAIATTKPIMNDIFNIVGLAKRVEI